MADRVKKIKYCYVTVPSRAGQGKKILDELKAADVNLLAFSGFPSKGGKAQLDLVPQNMTALRQLARKNGWRLSKVKKGFLIQGTDRIGAAMSHMKKLAAKYIIITGADAFKAGAWRYGMLMGLNPMY